MLEKIKRRNTKKDGRKICSTECDIDKILDYLVELFDVGLQCNTTRSYTSAILAFHDPTKGYKDWGLS